MSTLTEPWALAVSGAAGEPVPASAEEALRAELPRLWSDLDTAISQTVRTCRTPPGAWSVHALGLASRIILASRVVGATPWEQIGCSRLLDGTYQGLLTAAGIEHAEPGEDDLRQIRQWVQGD